jgi:hypothetical protein
MIQAIKMQDHRLKEEIISRTLQEGLLQILMIYYLLIFMMLS